MSQADLGVPVWRALIGSGGEYGYTGVDPIGFRGVAEPGIWHPTSPADLAAMRERIAGSLYNLVNAGAWLLNDERLAVADAVMAALFGSSAT